MGGVGGSGETVVLNARTGGVQARLLTDNVVRSLTLHPAEDLVAVVLRGGEIRTCRLPDLAQAGPVLRHAHEVRGLAFAPDGTFLASASWDGTAMLWDWRSGRPRTAPMPHPEWPRFAHVSPDGQRLATGADDGVVRLWDTGSGNLVREIAAHPARATWGGFSPDGRWLATAGNDHVARLWSTDAGAPGSPALSHANEVVSLSFHPASHLLLTAARDHAARLWTVPNGLPHGPPLVHGGGVLAARFSPDGDAVATTSLDRTLRLWRVESPVDGTLVRPLDGIGRVVAVNSAGNAVSVGDSHGSIRVLGADGHREQILLTGRSDAKSVSWTGFAPDSRWVGATSRDGTVRLWRRPDHTQWPTAGTHAGGAWCGVFVPGGREFLSGGADGRILRHPLGELASGPEPEPCGQQVIALAVSPDGRWLAAGTGDPVAPSPQPHCALHLVDNLTGRRVVPPLPAGGPVRATAFHPSGDRLAFTAGEGQVLVIRVPPGPEDQPVSMAHATDVYSVEWSSDGRRLLTGSADATARVWNPVTGEPLLPALRHHGTVRARWAAGDRLILTASHDHHARLWDAVTGEAVSGALRHEGSVFEAVWAEASGSVVTVARERHVRFWPFPPFAGSPERALRLARALAGEEVDPHGGRVPLHPGELAAAWRMAFPDRSPAGSP
jgi:WD40 repeat protein